MSEPLPQDDDQLVERLRAAARAHDPVPPSVLAAGRSAFAFRTLDDELADLLFDSLLDDALVGIRGSASRQLTFGSDDVTIDLDVDDDGLVGQLGDEGGDRADVSVELQTPRARAAVAVDGHGRFFLERPTSGPFRLQVEVRGRRVTTEWVNL